MLKLISVHHSVISHFNLLASILWQQTFYCCKQCRYVMGIGEADAFSERLKQELVALEAANVYQLLQSEPLIDEVLHSLYLMWLFFFGNEQ